MKTKKLIVLTICFLMLSVIVMTAAAPNPWPKLPTVPVTLEITNKTAWTFPFDVALTNVPAGFDVSNGAYTGWCVDVTHGIDRSLTYQVKLYSSLDAPAEGAGVEWDMINYILNHKDAGTGADIQDAIWYFVNGRAWFTWTSPTPHTHTATAEAIVADALAHGDLYVPGPGEKLAIICVPQEPPTPRGQLLIIEISVPEKKPGFGKVTGGGQCVVEGQTTEIPSASFGFNAMAAEGGPVKGEINYVDHTTGVHVHVHDVQYISVYEYEKGNKPWPLKIAEFGGPDVYSGKMVNVYVEDRGEPGKNDRFLIFLGGEYLGGSGVGGIYEGGSASDVPILAGNIQIHKPPYGNQIAPTS